MLKLLRHRLKPRKSKKFLGYLHEKFPGLEADHLIGSMGDMKLNDFFIVMRTREDHRARHDKGFIDFDDDFIRSIENLLDYVQYLEGKAK